MITFRSSVGPDIIMFDEVAKKVLKLLGKEDAAARGIIIIEDLPQAIQKLKSACGLATTEDAWDDEAPPSLARRLPPLIVLFEIAQANRKPVTWGV